LNIGSTVLSIDGGERRERKEGSKGNVHIRMRAVFGKGSVLRRGAVREKKPKPRLLPGGMVMWGGNLSFIAGTDTKGL